MNEVFCTANGTSNVVGVLLVHMALGMVLALRSTPESADYSRSEIRVSVQNTPNHCKLGRVYRGTSLIRSTLLLGPYRRTIPRVQGGS